MNSKGLRIALMAVFLGSSLTLASCQKKEATNATNTTNTTNATNATAPVNATNATAPTNATNATKTSKKMNTTAAAPVKPSATKSSKPKVEGC